MYSRSTGFTPESMSAEALRAKYAAKTAARAGQRREIFAVLPEKKQESEPVSQTPVSSDGEFPPQELIIPAILALLLSDRDKNDTDFILAAALLFVQMG